MNFRSRQIKFKVQLNRSVRVHGTSSLSRNVRTYFDISITHLHTVFYKHWYARINLLNKKKKEKK